MHTFPTDHAKDPLLCFRQSKKLSLDALVKGIELGEVTATPRLGRRDESHPKGYYPGQVVTVCVCGGINKPCPGACKKWTAQITKLLPRPLYLLTPADLAPTKFYNRWEEVRNAIALYERRWIWPEADVTIVSFAL